MYVPTTHLSLYRNTHTHTHRTQVAVDTLAYQYTRKPPKITKPRDNVIVRLCSIECNFAVPFSDESNKAFRDDMVGWSNISERIWIWNYVTDFGNYVMPWPDYDAIPKNIRWFANHSVRGLYQEANYQSYGGDCAELKTYLMSKLMWDQSLNETDIVTEFLELYFSKSIAPHIQAYLDLWIEQVKTSNFYLGESVPYVEFETLLLSHVVTRISLKHVTCVEPFISPEITRTPTLEHRYTSSYLNPKALLESARLLNTSESLSDSTTRPRVQNMILSTMYVILLRWNETLTYADANKVTWPYMSRDANETLELQFAAYYNASGVTHLNEGGNDLNWLRQQVAKENLKLDVK